MTKQEHTTNYFETFIEVAPDTKATKGIAPIGRGNKKTVAEMQYEMMAPNPYKFTSDEILFQVFAMRNDLTEKEYNQARQDFFSKGQPCLRTSPLAKTNGFGFHFNKSGKVALVAMETEAYQQFLSDSALKKVSAMRSSRKFA